MSAWPQGYRSALLWDRGLTWPYSALLPNCAVQSPVNRNSEISPVLLVYCLLTNLKSTVSTFSHTLLFPFWQHKPDYGDSRFLWNVTSTISCSMSRDGTCTGKWTVLSPGSVIHCLKPFPALLQFHQYSTLHTRRPISISLRSVRH